MSRYLGHRYKMVLWRKKKKESLNQNSSKPYICVYPLALLQCEQFTEVFSIKVYEKLPDHKSYCVSVLVTQSCLSLCDPTDCSRLGSSVHGILQARMLEWVAISFSRGSSWPRYWTWVSYIAGLQHCNRLFTDWATREDFTSVKSFLPLSYLMCK